ncbi:MAG: T9SS type A sorting domain-containing protein [Bacteroidales bacterium]|nr:T9SS type A sorting domain-containing protein [Bacteroidales bacterium]
MKKKALIIFILFLFYGTASPQSCLPEGITFTTQEQIDNFQTNYPGCTEIEGDVEINGNDITNLDGLNVLTAIVGDLRIWDNYALTTLSGLRNVTSIGEDLRIWNNDTLTSLSGLGNVTSIGGEFCIKNNPSLIDLSELGNLSSIGGYMSIWGNAALTNLTGLDNVTSIEGGLYIGSNYALTSITGLGNVTLIGGLNIKYNNALTSLSGLDHMTSLGGSLLIEDNDALTSLSGLDHVTSIGGYLEINDNNALTSLTELDNIISIGGFLTISDNDALTSLSGLDNIAAFSIDGLCIYDNISLSTCEVQSICNYLISSTGTIQIYNNAPGCNSQEEVEEACESVSVESLNPNEEISIFPNPANKQLTLSSKDGTTIEEVIIYNQTGQIVLLEKPVNNIVDISLLQPGLYIIEVASGQRVVRERLMIE